MEIHDDKYILLTGGAGFIGSAVLRQLNLEGFTNIIIADDLNTDCRWQNLVGKQFTDIIHKDHVFDWLETNATEVEAIIHLGACVNTVESDANYLLKNNYHYSVELAKIAIDCNYRFIYASSAATYGNGFKGFSDDHSKLNSYEPLNMYGYSKHLFDLWCQNQGLLDQVVGLKYFNVFGPNEYHKGRMASTIFHFLPQVREKGKIRLFKSNTPDFQDGDQCRDFIYVKDVARMTCMFLKNTHAGIFNIGRGIPGTWNQLAQAVIKSSKQQATIEYIDIPQDLLAQYQNYTCADMTKFRKAFPEEKKKGLETMTIPLEEAVADYIQNYLLSGKRW